MTHTDANKSHIDDLFEFRDNLTLSEDKEDREFLRMINEGEAVVDGG